MLEPVECDAPKFDSISLNYLLHCLPGDIRSKSVVFENLKRLANPNAAFFGATLLYGGVQRNWLARRVMDRNIAHGIFSNAQDDLDGLRLVLSEHLTDPTVETTGCVAIFHGTLSTELI